MNNVIKENILGFLVFKDSVERCVETIFSWILYGDTFHWMACLNPHSYVVSLDDLKYANALHSADWLIPDGVGVILASRFQKGEIRTRITGHDIFTGVHERLNHKGGRVFFLGSTEETLTQIRNRMTIDYPNVQVVGTYSPPFKSKFSAEDNQAMVAVINAAKPDVLWVGMTAPKQEKWIYENKDKLQVKFAGAIGAVFDFYTGKVKRSHPVFQRLGLEWFPRLIQEPRRLWRRNFISSPKFLAKVFLHKFKNGKRG